MLIIIIIIIILIYIPIMHVYHIIYGVNIIL